MVRCAEPCGALHRAALAFGRAFGAVVMAQNIPDSVAAAVYAGNVSAVNAWLRHGGDEFVNETLTGEHFDDRKLISQALKGDSANSPAIIELLLVAGASPETRNLMSAISWGNVEAALLLVDHGVDVEKVHGVWTALHFAAERGEFYPMARQADLVRALLEAGAPVDARKGESISNTGGTPLQVAAGCGFTEPGVLELLLKYGADVDAVDAEGLTAEDHARAALDDPRGPGVVEGALALFRDYRAAGGTWKRYANEPRKQLLVLRKLVERGRARPPRSAKALAGLFGRKDLPDVLFWKVLAYWRSDRDV